MTFRFINLPNGSTYTIDSLEGVSEIRINNLQMNNNEQTTLINIPDSGTINMPTITDGSGNQFSTNDYIGSVTNTMNLVWSIPNASKVVFGASAFVGHVIAPNADVEKLQGNSAGCIICKNIKGVEIHYYPFNGTLDIPKKEKKYAFISKVDEDSGDSVSEARIEVYDALGELIDEWTTAGAPHKVSNLEAGETYTIKETTTPQGYSGSSDIKFTVAEDGTITFDESTPATLSDGTILIKNKLLKTDVTITKHSETTDGETLSGAEYILYRTKGNTTEYYTGTNTDGYATWSTTETEAVKKETQDNGIATFTGITITKSDTENTTYYFKEVKAPRLYKLDETPIEVEIDVANYTEGQAIAHKDQKNDKITVTAKIAKVDEAIKKLSTNGLKINFNTISKESGVSKNFLYNNDIVKNRIIQLRNQQINHEINQRAKFDKTAKSKDVIIQAKDKKIAKLEEENTQLKLQLQFLQTRLYEDIK